MKILTYEADYNTATTKNKTLTQARDNIYYYIETEWNVTTYFYYLKCKNDIFYPVCTARTAPENLTERFFNIDQVGKASEEVIFNNLKEKMENLQFVSNLDVLFCELMDNSELASACRKYHDAWLEKSNREYAEKVKAEQERAEQERLAQEKAKQERDANDLKHAYEALKNMEKMQMTARQFELLCKANNINIPLRTLGYLQTKVGYVYALYAPAKHLDGTFTDEKFLQAGYTRREKTESKGLYNLIFKVAKMLWKTQE